jgi:hypothetical protein
MSPHGEIDPSVVCVCACAVLSYILTLNGVGFSHFHFLNFLSVSSCDLDVVAFVADRLVACLGLLGSIRPKFEGNNQNFGSIPDAPGRARRNLVPRVYHFIFNCLKTTTYVRTYTH